MSGEVIFRVVIICELFGGFVGKMRLMEGGDATLPRGEDVLH